MKTKIDKTLVIATVICLLPIVLAAFIYEKLPMQIPVHFDNAGNPDSYLPKAVAAFGLPVIFTVLNWYTHFRINHDPRVDNTAIIFRQVAKWLVPILSIVCIPASMFIAMGVEIPINMISSAMVGVIIMISGNYLPKSRQNYTVGIKLPWTLDSDVVWNKTHRFAGFLWVIGGGIITLGSFISAYFLTIPIVIVLVLVPLAYSYYAYKAVKRGVE